MINDLLKNIVHTDIQTKSMLKHLRKSTDIMYEAVREDKKLKFY